MMPKTLWDLKPKIQATIQRIDPALPADYQLRLRELGFQEGESIVCVRHTPFAGPAVYCIGDSIFSIAPEVARFVEVVLDQEAGR